MESIYSDELMHDGRKGMKWYQHIFGKDTKSSGGKKGSGDDDDETKTSGGSSGSKSSASSGTSKPKSVKDMSDAELRAAIARKKLEDEYLEKYPQETSKGKALADTIMDKVIKPAAIDAGKAAFTNLATAQLNNLLGVERKKDIGPVLADTGIRASLKKASERAKQEKADNEAKANAKRNLKEGREQVNEYINKLNAEYEQSIKNNPYATRDSMYRTKGSDIKDRTWRDDSDFQAPAIVNNAIMKTPISSEKYADMVYKGERYAQDILDKNGKTIVRLNKNGKRKFW